MTGILWHLALVAVWPRTVGSLIVGNTDMWVAAAVAMGLRFGWPAALVLVKPTLAPLALVGARKPAWWVAMAVAAALSLGLLPLWFDWLTVIGNGPGPGLTYSLLNLPLPAAGLVAWVGRTRRNVA